MAQGLGELREVLREALEKRGVLGEIKARVRAEVFNALDEDDGEIKPKLSNENLIINELFREYLVYNGYRHTLSVFMPETGQPEDAAKHIPRELMVSEFGIREDETSAQLPLLYGIVGKLQADASAATAAATLRRPHGSSVAKNKGKKGAKSSPVAPPSTSSSAPIPGQRAVSSTSTGELLQPRPFEFSGGND